MAAVYLALDLRHDRRVALKVLKPELAAVLGAERFLQEIRTTAALQHPHILPLFDSSTADGFLFYVMPFIEGETLRERLNRETQLPVDEAVSIATDVADALQYAHEQGVIHRDIKPENILLANGRPMVADFGIALAVSSAAGTRLTETGLSLGTPHYMSPEQATADKAITARSDIYSLASVLYEMLTGNPPHTGSSAQQIIVKIIAEPVEPATRSRKSVPPNVEAALGKALEKLPADRFSTAREFADALLNPAFRTSPGAATAGALPAQRRGLVPALAAAAVVATALAAWGWLRSGEASPPLERHRVALSPNREDGALPMTWPFSLAIAPDGSAIVFADSVEGGGALPLYLKERDQAEARPLPGTEGGSNPFFSPDGRWVGFATRQGLFKIPRTGGTAIHLSDSTGSFATVIASGAWLEDGSIVFPGRGNASLFRVDADGRDERLVLPAGRVSTGGIIRVSPLPESRGVLITTCLTAPCYRAEVWVLDLRRDSVAKLADDVSGAWFMPPGHVLLGRPDGNLFAQGLDIERLALAGTTTPVLGPISTIGAVPMVAFSWSGTVLYATGAGPVMDGATQLVWVGRDGRETTLEDGLPLAGGIDQGLSVSPEGDRLALVLTREDGSQIAVKELPDGPVSRVTFAGANGRPVWTPDGRDLLFIGERDGRYVGLQRRADGTGSERVVASEARPIWEVLPSPDGQWILYRTDFTTEGRGDILARRVTGDTATVTLAASPAEEGSPAVSPDGRWLAYASDESGRMEIYVRPFPDVATGRWQVSRDGGSEPMWNLDGRELYFRAQNGQLTAAGIVTSPSFRVTGTTALLDASAFQSGLSHANYAVAPDERFVFARRGEDSGKPGRTILVRNLFTELVPLLKPR